MNAHDREIEELERDLESGKITSAEFSKQMCELQRDYQAAAEESARDAYDRELDRWY